MVYTAAKGEGALSALLSLRAASYPPTERAENVLYQ